MEEQLLHQIVARRQIVIQSEPFGHHVRMHVAVLQLHAVDAGDLVIEIPADEHVQLLLGVLVRVQLAQQTGIEPHPVDVLLGQSGRIELQGDVTDAVHAGGHFDMADAGIVGGVVHGIGPDLLRQALHGDGLDLGHERAGVLVLRRGVGFIHDRLQLFLGHFGLDLGHLLLQCCVLLLLFTGGRIGRGEGVKVLAQQPVGGRFLQEALLVLLVQLGELFLLLRIGERITSHRVVIGKGIHHAFHRVSVFLSQFGRDVQRSHGAVHHVLREAILRYILQRFVHQGFERLGVVLVHAGSLEDNSIVRPGHLTATGKGAGREGALEALVQHGAPLVQHGAQMVYKVLLFDITLHIGAKDVVDDGGLIGHVRALRHGIGKGSDLGLRNAGIPGVLMGKLGLFIGCKGLIQQFQERSVVLELTVEERETVGGMIVLVVIILHLVPGHLRDVLRKAAVAVAQSSAGEGQIVGIFKSGPLQGHGTLHLGIDHALIGKLSLQAVQVIVPSLGAEDALVSHDERMEAGIHVVIRQVQQLLLGQGRHGVAGAGIGGVGVQIGVVGLIPDIEEQRRGRVFLGAEQGGVLEHVRKSRVVIRPRREGELKGSVGVLVGDPEELGAGALMLEEHQLRADHLEGTDLLDFEAMDHISHLGQRRIGFSMDGFGRTAHTGQRQQQGQRNRQQFFHVHLLWYHWIHWYHTTLRPICHHFSTSNATLRFLRKSSCFFLSDVYNT